MKRHSVGHVAAMVLAAADMLGIMRPAMSQNPKPVPAPAQERSAPPDTTPYVRPVIPEDTMKTPLQRPALPPGQEPSVPPERSAPPESSSPPDTTPYVRPVIPEDTMKTPLPRP